LPTDLQEYLVSTPPSPTALAPIRVPAGTTAMQALKDAGVPLKGPDGAVVVRDVASGDLKDLAWAPEADADVEPVPAASADGRAVIRHSTAHVLAQAVLDLFPRATFAIGPPIEDGFYYDFQLPPGPDGRPGTFTPDDLERIDARMREIIAESQPFVRDEIADDAARKLFADHPFKLEIIDGEAEDPTSATEAGLVRT
jgi:threonyl-tRNA synthetase